MAEFQNTIDLFGDKVVAASVTDKTIEEYDDNVITTIATHAFYQCKALASVNLPNVKSIGEFAFYECSKLASVSIPSATIIVDNSFRGCSLMTSLDMQNLTEIGTSAFVDCTKLNTLVLRGETVCTLSNTNALSGTPFAAGKDGGTVYVPQALITEYQNATNWSTLYAAGTCNFVAIEGSEYE